MKKILLFVTVILIFSINVFAQDVAIKMEQQEGVTKYRIYSDSNIIEPQIIDVDTNGDAIFIVSNLEPGMYSDLKVVAIAPYTLTYTNDEGEVVTSVQEVEGPARPFALTVPEMKVSKFSLGTVE